MMDKALEVKLTYPEIIIGKYFLISPTTLKAA